MKQIAILGPTASGKTAAAIELAHRVNASILSLDSLAIYKEVDIVSAKPTIKERQGIRHFGIDELYLNQYFSAAAFFDIYQKAKTACEAEGKNLIIVGGTGFYLKSLMEGLSEKIEATDETKRKITQIVHDLSQAYQKIVAEDPEYAAKIAPSDRYRIQKWYEIYLETGMAATEFFKYHRRKPVMGEIPIFEINIDREVLRNRIATRTTQMIKNGLIEEVFRLEKKYTRKPNPMKAIGIAETLDYLDGKYSLSELHEAITTHTYQLAKRQRTFNNSQFPQKKSLLTYDLIKLASNYFN